MIPVNHRIPATSPANLNVVAATLSSDTAAVNKTRSHEEYLNIWQEWEWNAPCGEEKERHLTAEKLRDCLQQDSDKLTLCRLKLSSLPVLPAHLKSLTLNASTVTTLPSLPHNLKKLNICDNQITSLPELPQCLRYLDVSYNNLTQLPELPSDLIIMNASFNKITALPLLPSNIKELIVTGNRVSELTELPDSINILNLNNNSLTRLPVLPRFLTNLDASNNCLTEPPRSLPQFLKSINLSFNELTKFPNPLPHSLNSLNLSSNQITEFSIPLPHSLNSLNLSSNQITEFSIPLPHSLNSLNLSSNQITEFSIPLPHSLNSLNLSSNQITELSSLLPSSVFELDLSFNHITAFPNPLPLSLRNIILKGNRLSGLPESVTHLNRRCSVDVCDNPIPIRRILALRNFRNEDNPGPAIYFSINGHQETKRPERPLYQVVATWLPGESGMEEKWHAIASEANASTFSAFLDRLADTVNAQQSPEFKEKVAAWLTILAASPGLREMTFMVALGATATCEDRVSHTWNEMQKLALIHRVENGEFDNNLSELITVGRVMFRLKQLEKLAREKVKKLFLVDEIAIWLAFQTMLRDNLALSPVAKAMRFFGVSGVTQSDLKDAEIKVKTAENSIFFDWFSRWTPWHKVLERIEPVRWQQAMEAKYKALEEDYPQKVASKLAAVSLTGDADAERICGNNVMDEMERGIFTALTHEALATRKLAPLINWQWPV